MHGECLAGHLLIPAAPGSMILVEDRAQHSHSSASSQADWDKAAVAVAAGNCPVEGMSSAGHSGEPSPGMISLNTNHIFALQVPL
jgi:hypothetical protein